MTQESGGADPQINPPSFIPSAGRRSRASSQTPRTITPSSSSRTPRAAGGNDNGIPPSFSANRDAIRSQHAPRPAAAAAQHSADRERAPLVRLIPQRRAQSAGIMPVIRRPLTPTSKRVHEVQPSWPAGGGNSAKAVTRTAVRRASRNRAYRRSRGAGRGAGARRVRRLAAGWTASSIGADWLTDTPPTRRPPPG